MTAVASKDLTGKAFSVDDAHPDWCGGCGDFGILSAVKQALAQLGRPPHEIAVISGIGCAGKLPHYLGTYGLHTLHGRALNVATGVKLANQALEVLVAGGDGDGYGIGAGYLVNSGRRNVNFTYLVHNNGVYGLTKGQAAPTMRRGEQTKSMTEPSIQSNVNPIGLAIASGYTFVARGYAMAQTDLVSLIVQAVQHRGTAILDILQPCPIYNDLMTVDFFRGSDIGSQRVYKLAEEGFNGRVEDPGNVDEIVMKQQAALAKSFEWGDRIPTGILYQIDMPTYEDGLAGRNADLASRSLLELMEPGHDVSGLEDMYR
jgi:2-oxoglutarate ferredoxin oxidoreductase subunit beta